MFHGDAREMTDDRSPTDLWRWWSPRRPISPARSTRPTPPPVMSPPAISSIWRCSRRCLRRVSAQARAGGTDGDQRRQSRAQALSIAVGRRDGSILQDDLGMLMRGEIIWQKARGAGGSCAWGSFRSPQNPVLRDVTERVIVASKGRFDRAVKGASGRRRACPISPRSRPRSSSRPPSTSGRFLRRAPSGSAIPPRSPWPFPGG